MEFGRLAFIFISPERLQSKDFRNRLKTAVGEFPVSLAVIDEAHCVSEWGHDFRPSYLHLPHNLQRYCSGGEGQEPTLVGLTGTASFAVLADIQMEMQVKDEDAIILPRSFDRKEICFAVTKVSMSEKASALQAVKRRMPRILGSNSQNFYDPNEDRTNSGIVFCPHVNGSLGVTSIAQQLGHRNFFAGQKPKNFDGESQWNEHKKKLQKNFKNNRIQELVATKSFGMGIDKSNIRYTIHYVVPQSVEAFYQEAGRAGRNGKEKSALCSVLYSDDNWDSALEILNEPDHKVALGRLESINQDNHGDLLVQLWLLFNSYGGRSEEKKLTFNFWKENLEPVIADMQVVGATNTKDIVFEKDKDRERKEKAIFRLMLLGVVQDYTIDWGSSHFAVTVKRISPSELKDKLRDYLTNYKFADFADSAVSTIPEDTTTNALQKAVGVLIDFIYDEIVTKRKQALRTMGELCRNFANDQEFRESILAYLQESEFSDELREWIKHDFNDIGLEAIHDLLGEVTDLEEVKRLVGTARRMLDEDPQNLALRYLSMCARAQSRTESDSSVQQEATTLVLQIKQNQSRLDDSDSILLSILNYIDKRRPKLLNEVGGIVFRDAGTVELARLILRSEKLAKNEFLRAHAVKLLLASVLRKWINRDFNDIGLEAIHNLLGKVTDLEEVKLLVGTARRMLDEAPQNLALRYLSMCARAQSETESDSSVQQEATTLVLQIKQSQSHLDDSDSILLSILNYIANLNDIADRRPELLNEVGGIVFRDAGTVELSRLILRSEKLAKNNSLRAHAVILLLASVHRTLEECTFYTTLREETGNA